MELKSLLNPVSIPNGPIRCSRSNINLNNSFNTFPILIQSYNNKNNNNDNNNNITNITNEKSLLRSSNNEDLETIINAISSLKNNIYLKNDSNNNSNSNNNNQLTTATITPTPTTTNNVKIENITIDTCPSSPMSSEMSDDIKSEDDHHHHTKIAHGGPSNGKKPRKSYEVYKKLEILDEKNKHGMSFVVEKYHISRSIISRWLSNIEKYKSFNKKNLKKLHKGPKASFSMEQENMIIEKINQCRQVGEPVSGETIKKFALELSKELNNTSFKASSGWLENFKNRHSLQLK